MSSIFLATGVMIYVSRRSPRNVPAEPARRPSQDLVRNGLGIRLGNLPQSEFPEVSGGVFIDELASDDGPAGLAKIQAGDVLTELNGQAVRNVDELVTVLESVKPGTEVPAKIFRDSEILTLPIKIANPNFSPPLPEVPQREQGLLGVNEIGSRRYIPSANKWGVTIGTPTSNGPADLVGLQRGDIVTEFNGYAVRTHNEFSRRVRATKPRTKVTVKFFRNNVEQQVEMIVGRRG
jgi:S1-C subfamily serine protease